MRSESVGGTLTPPAMCWFIPHMTATSQSQQPINQANQPTNQPPHSDEPKLVASLPMIFADQKNQSTNHEVDPHFYVIGTHQKEHGTLLNDKTHVCLSRETVTKLHSCSMGQS